MELCRRDTHAKTLRFEEIERDFTFHEKDAKGEYIWRFETRERKARGGMHVGMIYAPSRRNPELFSTYLLALQLRGIQSFEDLCTLNRTADPDYDPARPTSICANAIAACIRRNLMTSDETWIEVMEQVACTIHHSRLFVRFFVSLLLFSQPSDPKSILERFIDRLLAPQQRGRPRNREVRYQQLLRLIQRQLEEVNCSMRQFGLPEPEPDNRTVEQRINEDLIPPVLDTQTGDPVDLSDAERIARATQMYEQLNAQQRAFIDQVLERELTLRSTRPVSNRADNLFLLEGAAGTGKTYTLNVLLEMCHARGIAIRACASTGKAATHLLNACTAHSLFGIPVLDEHAPASDMRFSTIKADSFKGNLLRRVAIFIIDEVGMLNVDDIYCINMLLKDLRDTSVRFGRVLMIFTGDVRQIMPIVKNADPLGDRQSQASFFFSGDCAVCTRVTLTDNMRVRQSADHANFLAWQQLIGFDRYEHVQLPQDRLRRHTRYIRLPSCFARFDEAAFVAEIYTREVLEGDPMQLLNRVILAPINSIVDRVNRRVTAMMPSDRPTRTYLSVNTPDAYDVYDPTSAILATDNLQSIESANMPPHALTLRIGTPVMCMQNLDVANGICNGTTMIVEQLCANIVWVKVKTRFGLRSHPIAPTRFIYSSNGFKFTRTQLPIRVAFAVTINRAQGATYDYVALHATYPIWAHGMLFVAVTRVTSPEGLTILCDPNLMVDAPGGAVDESGSIQRHATTRNIVHPRVSGRLEQVRTETTLQQPQPPMHVVEEEDPETSYGPEFMFYDRQPDPS
jgi:hypothetical protein